MIILVPFQCPGCSLVLLEILTLLQLLAGTEMSLIMALAMARYGFLMARLVQHLLKAELS